MISGEARWLANWAGGDAGFGRRDWVGRLRGWAPRFAVLLDRSAALGAWWE